MERITRMAIRPLKIIAIPILLFLIGIFYLFIFSNKNNVIFLIIGSLCIFLSFGLFKLLNFVRIMAIGLSCIFVLVYILLIVYGLTSYSYHHGFAAIGLILHLPLLLLCIWTLDCLNKPDIKNKFKSFKKFRGHTT